MRGGSPSGVRRRFRRLFRPRGQVAHVLLTLPPLGARRRPVRLACLIHAASVHSEPGSNSPSLKSHGRATRGPCRFISLFFLRNRRQGANPMVSLLSYFRYLYRSLILRCPVSKELAETPHRGAPRASRRLIYYALSDLQADSASFSSTFP